MSDPYRQYQATPRGVGLDSTPGCFCCGGNEGLHNNTSLFVPTRETGEAIVAMFASGARLDYRPSEPGWIQVKVGACDRHLPNLESLQEAIRGSRESSDLNSKYFITHAMVRDAIRGDN